MLDITQTIMSLTGITDEVEAAALQERAEGEIRLYLNYTEEDSVQRFSSAIIDIACTLNDQQKAEREAALHGGLKSESFSEGGVSTKMEYIEFGTVSSSYKERIGHSLEYLKPYRRGHVLGTEKQNADRR